MSQNLCILFRHPLTFNPCRDSYAGKNNINFNFFNMVRLRHKLIQTPTFQLGHDNGYCRGVKRAL